MQPLYCYKLDELTGQLAQYKIEEYSFHKNVYGNKHRDTFQFRGIISEDQNYRYVVERGKLDRYVSQKLFTFNPSIDDAMKKVRKSIEDKRDKSKRECFRYESILRKLGGNCE